MAVNKVVYGKTTVIDITDSTVTASNLKSGETAYGANGQKVTGTLVVPEVLDDLSDVVITTPQTAQEIYFDGTNWINYGAKIVLTFDDDFKGQTITMTKGQTTITKTAPLDSNTMNLYINETGLWTISSTISGDTYETEVNVTTFGTSFDAELVIGETVPQGSTVTPTDDIQTWLACANLDKPYTTLEAVLADRETFETLIADSNACDYMARSTTWAKAEGIVPKMTSNTTPSGECIGSGDGYSSTYSKWMAFNPDEMRGWLNDNSGPYIHANNYVGYTPTSANRAISCDITLVYYSSANTIVGKIQGNDGTSWIDLTENITVTSNANDTVTKAVFTKNIATYTSYRWICVTAPTNNYTYGLKLQFYAEADITTSQDAMALIGKYDYCSDALLSNATWCEAIANSDYFEEVLNVKVPTMTSATTPSGEVTSSTAYSSFYNWHAFDGSTIDSSGLVTLTGTTGYIDYEFPTATVCNVFKILNRYDTTNNRNKQGVNSYKIRATNDGSTWVDLASGNFEMISSLVWQEVIFQNSTAYKKYELQVLSNHGDSGYISILEMQFYGRASSEVLVPLVPTMTSNTTPSGECIANGYITNYPEYYGFDKVIDSGNNAHCWAVAGTSGWLGYHFPSAVKVDQIVLTQRTESGAGQNQNVKTATIQYSDDGTTWVDDANGIQTYSQAVANTVNVAENNAHAYWRINVASIYNDTAGAVAILELQFYQKTVQTNIVHSCANDTIYYMEDNSPVIVATTNSDGDGILDFSSLEDKEYTFYSSVAKDPNNLSNDYSKTIRITKSEFGGTTEMYLMPDTVKTLYWYGYMSTNFEETSPSNGWTNVTTYYSPTFNTNYLTMNASANNMAFGVGNKTAITGMSKAYAIGSGSGANAQFACRSQKSFTISITNYATFSSLNKYELTNNSDDGYITANAQYRGNSITLYAMWYE